MNRSCDSNCLSAGFDFEFAVRDIEAGEQRIAVLQDGDFFGEISLLIGSPRTATVRSTALTTCIALDKTAFDDLLSRSPHIRERMTKIANSRLAAQVAAG